MNASPLLRARRCPPWLGVLAVAVFGLRALVPSGYMLAVVDGHTRLVMCAAGFRLASGMPDMPGMTHDGAMDSSADGNRVAHAAPDSAHCPYALSSGAGLPGRLAEPQLPFFVLLQPTRAPAVESVPVPPPPRFHAPRGPPSLA